jgi:hypothetical protein
MRHTPILATAAEQELRRKEAQRVARDWALDRIEDLETALQALKWEAKMNPHGFMNTPEGVAFLTAHQRLTATDVHQEWIEEIENDLSEEAA